MSVYKLINPVGKVSVAIGNNTTEFKVYELDSPSCGQASIRKEKRMAKLVSGGFRIADMTIGSMAEDKVADSRMQEIVENNLNTGKSLSVKIASDWLLWGWISNDTRALNNGFLATFPDINGNTRLVDRHPIYAILLATDNIRKSAAQQVSLNMPKAVRDEIENDEELIHYFLTYKKQAEFLFIKSGFDDRVEIVFYSSLDDLDAKISTIADDKTAFIGAIAHGTKRNEVRIGDGLVEGAKLENALMRASIKLSGKPAVRAIYCDAIGSQSPEPIGDMLDNLVKMELGKRKLKKLSAQ